MLCGSFEPLVPPLLTIVSVLPLILVHHLPSISTLKVASVFSHNQVLRWTDEEWWGCDLAVGLIISYYLRDWVSSWPCLIVAGGG